MLVTLLLKTRFSSQYIQTECAISLSVRLCVNIILHSESHSAEIHFHKAGFKSCSTVKHTELK